MRSYPFASSTDFGGPDLQPPLRGLATFGSDYAVVLERPRAVELWRLDGGGVRRDGALVYPSALGDPGPVSSVTRSGRLTSTYADFTGRLDRAADRHRRAVLLAWNKTGRGRVV